MPGDSGGPVVAILVCFVLFRTRGCGCIGHPAFPTPSVFLGEGFMHNPGASRRGNADTHLVANLCVVPANAGTHNHRSRLEQKALATVPKREASAYGSPLSRGRH